MAILHGSWIINPQQSYFFIWGETWRKMTPIQPNLTEIPSYPYQMNTQELLTFLLSLKESGRIHFSPKKLLENPEEKTETSRKKSIKKTPKESPLNSPHPSSTTKIFSFPTFINTQELIPQYSPSLLSENKPENPLYLYPWNIEGVCLNPSEATAFLQGLPLGTMEEKNSFMGADLRFWSAIGRWTLDLLVRGKFLPSLTSLDPQNLIAQWTPILDSEKDQKRLLNFCQTIPLSCRFYQLMGEEKAPLINFPTPPEELIHNFLESIIDIKIRQIYQNYPESKITSVLGVWLKSLRKEGDKILNRTPQLEHLQETLNIWISPWKEKQNNQEFSTYFKLEPPLMGCQEWHLSFGLYTLDDPTWLLPAKTIWNRPVERLNYRGKTINFPQETLLGGLGLASKLYPVIESSLQEQHPHFCRLSTPQVYEFIKSISWRFQDTGLGVIFPDSLSENNRLGLSLQSHTPPVTGKTERLGLKSLLNFKWELILGGHTLSQKEFNRLINLGSPLVEINGDWVELKPQDIRAAQHFFTTRKDGTTLSLEDALRLASGDNQTIDKLPVINFSTSGPLEELLNALTHNEAIQEIPKPKNFKGELRPYQLRGVSWLGFLEKWGLGACLADDMGLGKTIELIAFLLHLQENHVLKSPVLLLCPTSVLGNWYREIQKFGPSLKVLIHHGDKRGKGKSFLTGIKGKDVIITSYPLVFRDLTELQQVKWQGIVLDEAQNVKNSEAKQSQAVRQLEASFKIALTGTPVENRLQELWSILEFLNPGYLGNRNFFQRRFAIPIEKYGDRDSLQTLRSLVRPFILRRLKTDKEIIKDLPEKQEMTIFCPLSTDQASLYQKIVEESLTQIESSDGIQRRGMILALLTRLKQVCNHPILLKEEEKNKKKQEIIKGIESGKLLRLQEMLEEVIAEGDRALIFTQFAQWGHFLKSYLEDYLGKELLFLYGGTRQQQREEMIERFQQDPQGPPIMILSLKAGGTGLNLTRATHVFHFDRWWNPAVENQATDRVFRIGQTRNVQVHKFVCTGTLEEKIHDMIESKKALAEQVVSAGEHWLTELDSEQLRNLLVLDRSAIIDEND